MEVSARAGSNQAPGGFRRSRLRPAERSVTQRGADAAPPHVRHSSVEVRRQVGGRRPRTFPPLRGAESRRRITLGGVADAVKPCVAAETPLPALRDLVGRKATSRISIPRCPLVPGGDCGCARHQLPRCRHRAPPCHLATLDGIECHVSLAATALLGASTSGSS